MLFTSINPFAFVFKFLFFSLIIFCFFEIILPLITKNIYINKGNPKNKIPNIPKKISKPFGVILLEFILKAAKFELLFLVKKRFKTRNNFA